MPRLQAVVLAQRVLHLDYQDEQVGPRVENPRGRSRLAAVDERRRPFGCTEAADPATTQSDGRGSAGGVQPVVGLGGVAPRISLEHHRPAGMSAKKFSDVIDLAVDADPVPMVVVVVQYQF